MAKIGLETHVQLTTNTKLFCGCPSKWQGKEPNTNVCEICLGMPGSKPVLNKKAVKYGIKIGVALNCKFPDEMFFSRKSYFYPDMSKNFQITQYRVPIAKNGFLEINGKKINISRIHLEEDPARLVHPAGITKSKYVLVDYNRSGVPLCEIVTEPDFRTPKEARLFLKKLSTILEYLKVFNASQEASARVDANISIKDIRVEVKNITGFKDVQRALNYEMVRQRNLIGKGKKIKRETRAWDDKARVTRSLRNKEQESDYGYIFEPDLTKITLHKDHINEIKELLPELPSDKIKRYSEEFNLNKEISKSISTDLDLALMFEKVIGTVDPQFAGKFFSEKLKKTLNYNNIIIQETCIKPRHLKKLLKMLINKKITENSAEMMLRKMVESKHPEKILDEEKMVRINDKEKIETMVDQAISENSKAVLDYKAGHKEAFDYLVGRVMKKSKGRADPTKVRGILSSKI